MMMDSSTSWMNVWLTHCTMANGPEPRADGSATSASVANA